ncbi:MAG: sigma-70 family RNA polymerase sigma factor [candidate division WOR-3 bacterium]|nr:sigma-70 family RNA polymerase sigma factor [candidate division WOR-3 bacterium]MCX7757293.1 sigma-70 family RNA polymerase sigma factor [candidate division WOR-3 bacterium]MDW7988031.1 sigma-70 family RNA polymerase sigma factor [candidate division WOR-3 bacterium]
MSEINNKKIVEENAPQNGVNGEELTDHEIIRKFKAGDKKCFEILVRRYYEKIYQLAYRMTQNRDDAWDITQESFLRAYMNIKKFQEKSSFYTWLYQICLNQCYNYYKKKQHSKNTISLDFQPGQNIEYSQTVRSTIRDDPESIRRQQYLAQKLSWAINKLPRKQQLIFIMRHFDDLTYEQIAHKLRISVGGVKSNYHHAIKKLQNLLADCLNEL